MGLGDEDEADEVFLLDLRAPDARAAATLFAVFRQRHPLDVAAVRKRDYARLVRYQILHRDLVLVRHDFRAALGLCLGAVARLDVRQILADERVHLLRVGEDGLEFGDGREQLGEFVGELVALQPRELVEPHLEDCVHLRLSEAEALDEPRLGLVAVARRAYHRDYLVQVVDGDEKSVENVLARLRLFQLEASAARQHVEAVVCVGAEEVVKVEDFRPSAVYRQHDCAERRLQLRVLVEVVEHDFRHRVALDLHDYADVRLGLVANVAHALDNLVLHEVGHVDEHFALVHRVRDFGDDDAFAAV